MENFDRIRRFNRIYENFPPIKLSHLPSCCIEVHAHYYYSLLASLLEIGIVMVLYQYYKKKSNCTLPDEKGKLSKIVPSSFISAANKEVSQLTTRASDLGKTTRGPYLKISAEKKTDIGKYAADHGIVAAIRHSPRTHSFLAPELSRKQQYTTGK